MASAYLRTIEFKVKDQALKQSVDKLGKSLGNIDKSVAAINKQFGNLAKSLKGIGTEFKQIATTLSKIDKRGKTGGGSAKELSKSAIGMKRLIKLKQQLDDTGPLFSGTGKSTDFNKSLKSVRKLLDTLGGAKGRLGETEAALARQAAAFNTIAANTRFATKKAGDYNTALFGMTKAEQALRFSQLQRIEVQRKLYTSGAGHQGFKNIDSLLGMEANIGKKGGIAKNIASLSIYRGELQKALSLVTLESKEYKDIDAAIARINKLLSGNTEIKTKEVTTDKQLNKLAKERERIEKRKQTLMKEAQKFTLQTIRDLGKFAGRGLGELGGVLTGQRGPLPQLVAGGASLEFIKKMITFVPFVNKKLKAQIRYWSEVGQKAIPVLGCISIAYRGLSDVLGAANWVTGAIAGFVEFESTAANIIWSVERNYQSAFSSMGRLIRQLPEIAAAAAYAMPQFFGGPGMGWKDMRADGELEAIGYNAKDTLLGDRLSKRRPSRVQTYSKKLESQKRRLSALNVEDDDYLRIKQEVHKWERLITVEKEKQLMIDREFRGKVDTLEAQNSKEALKLQKDKLGYTQDELDVGKRRNKLYNKSTKGYERLVNYGGKMLTIEQRIEEVQNRKQRKKMARERLGENLMLGAGFPLLFGGGVGSVGGGVLGAGLQNLTGSQGFGAQIFLSAIGQQLDTFVGKISTLGKAFNVLNPDVDAVISSLGETNTAYGKHLEMLKKIEGEGAAMKEAELAVKRIIGKEGLAKIKGLGDDATELGNQWAKVMLRMQASIAALITRTGILKALSESMAKGTDFQKANLAVVSGTASPELQSLWKAYQGQNTWQGSAKNLGQNLIMRQRNPDGSFKFPTQRELRPMIIDQWRKDQATSPSLGGLYGKGADKVAALAQEEQKLKDILHLGSTQAGIEEKIRNMKKDQITLSEKDYRKKLEGNAQLREAIDIYKDIGRTIEDGIVSAIEGAIKGTKTLGEVANSVLNQLSSKFLKLGINKLLGGLPIIGDLFKAEGGPVSGGSPYIVGEKGPELFVPNSSGNIVPNHAMGGSMVVNVDASGSSAEGDSDRSRQLGELIGAAVQSEIIRQQRPGGTLY